MVRNHEESKPRDPLYQQTTRTRFPRPDITIATDKGRYSLHVSGPADQETGEQEPRKLAGWSAFQHRDRLIRLLSQKTENWEAIPEHKRTRLLKQELEREEMKTRTAKLLNMTVQGRIM